MAVNSVGTSSTATSVKGFGGLVSGMNIDELVAKLTLGSKNKIVKEQQKSQKMKWKQAAYREVSSLLTNFKKNYFDTLSATNFRNPSFFNAFKASSSSDAIKVTSTSIATPGVITIDKVTQLAESQKFVSEATVSKALSGTLTQTGTLTDAEITALVTALTGKSITVNLDGKVRTLSLDATFASTASTPISAISLKKAFQDSMDAAFGKNSSGQSLVQIDITGNSLSFAAPSSRIILGGDTATLTLLGFEAKQSNKITTSNALKSLSLNSTLAGAAFKFSINSVAFSFTGDDSLDKIVSTINSSTAGVNLSYSSVSDKFTMTAKETGTGENIKFIETEGNLMTALLGNNYTVTGGKNAELMVNGLSISRSANTFVMDGTNFELMKTTAAGADPVIVTVKEDSASLFDPIVKFVSDYNTLIDKLNSLVKERALRDYQPLSEDQKKNMSEEQIKEWETKAKTGLLSADPTLSGIATKLQSMLYEPGVEGGIALYSIGITTAGWQQNGKLVIDETKLKEALASKGSEINELFTSTNGIANKMNAIIIDAVETKGVQGKRGRLIDIAGIPLHSSDTQNNISKDIEASVKAISILNVRLASEESRYWSQFSAMESALQKLNVQSSMLSQQFSK